MIATVTLNVARSDEEALRQKQAANPPEPDVPSELEFPKGGFQDGLRTDRRIKELVALSFPNHKIFPHSIEAEQSVIGALLVNNKVYENINEFLRSEHFYDPRHQKIYQKIDAMLSIGHRVDPILLNLEENILSENPAYLIDLVNSIYTTVNIQDYARYIHNLYVKRQLIEIAEMVIKRAYDDDSEAFSQLATAEEELFSLANKDIRKTGFTPLTQFLIQSTQTAQLAMTRKNRITGITSGLSDLDKRLGGFHKSDLIIIAGRPSMGKTAFGTTVALNCSRAEEDGGAVGFFSLEMAGEQIGTRLISAQGKISTQSIRRGKITSQEYQVFVESCHHLSGLEFYIDDTAGLSLSMLRTRARRLKRKYNIQMLVIDYLQMLQIQEKRYQENRAQEMSAITRELKFLAKELDIPIIVLSQLNRLVESREDKRPLLSDLRDSGTIEQDADVVMFVYRERYYLERSEPKRNEGESEENYFKRYSRWKTRYEDEYNKAELLIAKNRHGSTGRITLKFDSEFTTFSDFLETN